jgi:hypothetical protein
LTTTRSIGIWPSAFGKITGPENSPERKNLEFLVGLGNKIEHHHVPDLDAGLYGECQAALINLEALTSSEFGSRYALTEQLAVSALSDRPGLKPDGACSAPQTKTPIN